MENYTLFTDGSCLGNPGPGGWAAILREGSEEREISGGDASTTNNRMEMTAIIEGLRLVEGSAAVKIVSDSKYVIDAFRQGWIDNWQRSGWKTAAKKPVKNQDLWHSLLELLEPHQIEWEWVKGHAGHPENERVDAAAQAQAQRHA